ncbi:hypothetical protein [Georgenia faecalis]|uniref:Uncharacterized protein n=1 Tax=Georgenia faecalis TaxID=2483799 RepID=A0ABV9D844_9MICO|nr:hypothetical protein [Georgenia faecalis]
MRDAPIGNGTTPDVLRLLNEVDPYGLAPGLPDGAPDEEYGPEAAEIAQHLTTDGAITAEQIDAIWLHWFDQPLTAVVGPAPTERFVDRLNGLVMPTASSNRSS